MFFSGHAINPEGNQMKNALVLKTAIAAIAMTVSTAAFAGSKIERLTSSRKVST